MAKAVVAPHSQLALTDPFIVSGYHQIGPRLKTL